MALYQSITDKSVRWELEWISMESGFPVCLKYKDQRTKGGEKNDVS